MPYPDLGTMYQNGMGASASFMGGQMASSARAQDAEKLKQMQLENQQSAVMNPLNAQFKQGQINQQAAELPGIQGQSASLVAKGTEDMQLITQKIASKISAMSTQIGNDGMARMGQDAEKLLHAAQIIQNYPPHLQKQMFAKAAAAYGADVTGPMFQGLGQVPDDKFLEVVQATGKGMALSSQKFIQESSTAGAHAASAERIAKGNNDAQRDVATIAANSRVQAAQTRAKAMVENMGIDKAVAHYAQIPNRTEEEERVYVDLKTQQLQARAAGAPALAPTMLGQPSPLENAATAARGKPGAENATLAAHGDLDIASLAKKQKLPYDPSKFIYRIGPNGQVQSKPK